MLITTEYAIRALVLLAAAGKLMFARDVAKEAKIPPYFLAKILQNLARRGYLRSVKGPKGGFVMRSYPQSVTIADIICACEGRHEPSPYMGQRAIDAMSRYQKSTTIADLVREHRRAA